MDLRVVRRPSRTGLFSPGLKASSSTIDLDHVTISGIEATSGLGAGLVAWSSTVTATGSVIAGNTGPVSMDIEIQDTASVETFLDYVGLTTVSCSIQSGTCS